MVSYCCFSVHFFIIHEVKDHICSFQLEIYLSPILPILLRNPVFPDVHPIPIQTFLPEETIGETYILFITWPCFCVLSRSLQYNHLRGLLKCRYLGSTQYLQNPNIQILMSNTYNPNIQYLDMEYEDFALFTHEHLVFLKNNKI